MQVELTFSLVRDGGAPIEFHRKLEDGGPSVEFCNDVQALRSTLDGLMKRKIDEECKS